MHTQINYKKKYTLAYIYNHDADRMKLVSFTAKEIQEAYDSLPRHRGRVCWSHDLKNRLKEIIEISGRLEFNLTPSNEHHKSDTIRYVKCAYHDDCWNCRKTLKDDYATYMALSLNEIAKQRSDVEQLIGNTNNQEILFVFDSGPSNSKSLYSLFGDSEQTTPSNTTSTQI